MPEFSDELSHLKAAVRKAGERILEFYESGAKVKYKDGGSPVTEADLASQQVLFDELEAFGYAYLSEEFLHDQTRLDHDKIWVIDPLDGTRDFIEKTGEFSVIAGLVVDGRPIMGVVFQPTEDKLFFAEKGRGAFMEKGGGEPIRLTVSDVNDPSNVTLLRSGNYFREVEKAFAEKLGIKKSVVHGSAGLKICMITEQVGDLYICSTNKTGEWDVCGAEVILEEAGGKVTDMTGATLHYNQEDPMNQNGFMASNGKLHEWLIEEWTKHNS